MKSKLTVSVWYRANEFCKMLANRVGGQSRNVATIRSSDRQLDSLDQIDHSSWSSLLDRYVDGNGRVSYAKWQRSKDDKHRLSNYLRLLCRVPLSHVASVGTDAQNQINRSSQIAFWINAYNALTIYGILQVYPTQSIREHTAKFLGFNIWHDLRLQIEGRVFNLNAMEHSILRRLNEPRIHFAIVCASIGCPALARRAYEGQSLNQDLDERARSFFSSPTNFQFQERSNLTKLSSILDWFGCDFGNNESQMLQSIAAYLPTPSAREMASSGRSKISYLNYDWSLNDRSN